MLKIDLVIGTIYKYKNMEYELTAAGYFNVLVINHKTDEELMFDRTEFIRDFEEVVEPTKITLYRYTILYSFSNRILQSEWSSSTYEQYAEISTSKLLKTETKEVEI